MKPNQTRSIIAKIVMLLYVVAVAYLCFANFHKLPEVPKTFLGIPMDKIVHFCMFFPFPILAEWSKAVDSKSTERLAVPRVRISTSPPMILSTTILSYCE